jgi:DNA invertase Pin-like site-specific DNA recombinase
MIGYARVSTREQDTEMQYRLLNRAGCVVIFGEKVKAISKRPELQNALARLHRGDKLVVYKLDRIARSLRDLLNILEAIEARGAGFLSLTESMDTSTPVGTLVLHILGAIGQFERALIRERSMSGQAAARERGSAIGRPRVLTHERELEIVTEYLNGEATMQNLARAYSVHISVVKRAIYRISKPESSCLL